jgi:DNA mismatch endonuclease (patch repair protein)
VAVFVDGCFWHGCPEHSRQPGANADYWKAKIEGNVRRDAETDSRLKEAGWTVLRFWSHEDPIGAALRIRAAVKGAPGD